MILSRKEKESIVINLAEEGKATRDIAHAANDSLKDIGIIIRRHTGVDEGMEYQDKGLSINSRAFKLFIGQELDGCCNRPRYRHRRGIGVYSDYLRLLNPQKLMTLYPEMGDDDFHLLYYHYNQIKWEGLATKSGIHRIIGAAGELKNLDQTLLETASDIGRLNFFKSNLEKGVGDITRNISL